jgi:uncharacterized protein (TIGR00730 family)
MDISFSKPNPAIDQLIDELIATAEGIHRPEYVREMILSVLKTGQDCDYPADLKMMGNTIKEMRYTYKVFSSYRQRKKVTIFGSARIEPEEEIYRKCVRFSRRLAELGYMIITGGGPGIMQAGNEGAGSENSFAVNIRLPFEQHPNPVMLKNPRLINYKYFFNRKVAFVKETDAIAVFPGGFGTLDEAMEVFTLIQTGKTAPKPLVLIDDDSGYWDHWFDFVKEGMLGRGLISAEDFSIFAITRSEDEAIRIFEEFYRIYHSLRFVDHLLVIRLNRSLSAAEMYILEDEFPDLRLPRTRIEQIAPLPDEADEPDILHLPRIGLHFDHKHYGLLMAFIGRINTFQ